MQSSTNQSTQISKTTWVIIVIYTIYLLKKETLNVSQVYYERNLRIKMDNNILFNIFDVDVLV